MTSQKNTLWLWQNNVSNYLIFLSQCKAIQCWHFHKTDCKIIHIHFNILTSIGCLILNHYDSLCIQLFVLFTLIEGFYKNSSSKIFDGNKNRLIHVKISLYLIGFLRWNFLWIEIYMQGGVLGWLRLVKPQVL